MARSGSIETGSQAELDVTGGVDPLDVGFGAEFRELARQRRFVREDADSAPSEDWRAAAAPPSRSRRRVEVTPAAQAPAPTPAPAPTTARTAAPAAAAPAPALPQLPQLPPATATNSPRVRAPRISEDQRATLLELARMSDRLVESREALAVVTTRAAHMETELAASNASLAAANDRLMASRVLVQDAQRATRELAERCTWLEGRCETLQEALELAVNASVVTRWKWRREQRRRSAGA